MVRAAGLAEAFLQRAQAAMDAHNAAFFVHAAQARGGERREKQWRTHLAAIGAWLAFK